MSDEQDKSKEKKNVIEAIAASKIRAIGGAFFDDNALLAFNSGYGVGLSPAAMGLTPTFDVDTAKKERELKETIFKLQQEIQEKATELRQTKSSEKEKAAAIKELETKFNQLLEQEKLSFLLTRVNDDARKLLLQSAEFRKSFLENSECNSFVMAVDIRRSTELMSKARSPQQFAFFMTTLCRELEGVIKENNGVFDKFTGDGILAFFPEFFSGNDAGFYAIYAADRCHKIFEEKYRESRSSFRSVLTEVGLGIGIDYGSSHLVQIAGGLTVVGAPVVYACRMSGAPAGKTLLNQPGYEKISERFSAYCFFRETELEIKNEGATLAYEVQLNGKEYKPESPNWATQSKEVSTLVNYPVIVDTPTG